MSQQKHKDHAGFDERGRPKPQPYTVIVDAITRLDGDSPYITRHIEEILGHAILLDDGVKFKIIRSRLLLKTGVGAEEIDKAIRRVKLIMDPPADTFGADDGADDGGAHGVTAAAEIKNIIAGINKEHFLISTGGRVRVGSYSNHELGEVLTMMPARDFEILFASQHIWKINSKGELKPNGIGGVWLHHENRRQYKGGFGFDARPGAGLDLPGDRLNMWRGFMGVPQAGSWPLLKAHMLEVLANGNKDHANYICKWIAWKLQNPGGRPGVMLVFKSMEGSGKNTVFDRLRQFFGIHGRAVASTKHMTGDFNAHMRGVCFLLAGEAIWGGDHQARNKLYAMITDPSLMTELKGVDAVEDVNRLGIVALTNADWSVPAGVNARRFAVFRCSDKHAFGMEDEAAGVAYFDALNAELDGGGFEAFVHDMLTMDLGDWHPRQGVPQTEELVQEKVQSLQPVEKWWHGLLERGYLPQPPKGELVMDRNPRELRVHWASDEAQREYGDRYGDLTNQRIGNFLSKKLELKSDRLPGDGKTYYAVPPLAVCRAIWEAKFGKYTWSDTYFDWGAPK